MKLTADQTRALMLRVECRTPYGGANPLLNLLTDAVLRENPTGIEKLSHAADALDRLTQLCEGAAALLRDPDFVAEVLADVIADAERSNERDRAAI